MQKKVFVVILAVLVYGIFELGSWSALLIYKKKWGREYIPARLHSLSEVHKKALTHLLKQDTTNWIGAYSSTLGWTNRKEGKTKLYRTNSQGIRGDKEYTLIPPDETIRISAFGDSFTFSSDVSNEDAWAERLASMHSGLEVLNFGVGGYGLDQAFLRYTHEGAQFNAHINFIGFMTSNINRNVNIYRPFLQTTSQMPLAKPRFILKDNKLVLIKNPMAPFSKYQELFDHPEKILPQLAANDYFPHHFFQKEWLIDFSPSVRLSKIVAGKIYQKFMPLTAKQYQLGTPAFGTTVAIFDEFVKASLENNSLPIILIFPRINDVIRHQKGKPREYASLITSLKNRDYLVLDLLDVFIEHSPIKNLEELFITHYNPEVNQWIAQYLLEYLKTNDLLNTEGVATKFNQVKNTLITDHRKTPHSGGTGSG